MLQQPGVHRFQGADKGGAVGGAGQDHHHHAAAQDADNDFAHPCLGNIPQLGDVENIDHREGDDRRGVTRQLEGIGDVIAEVGAGPGANSQPRRHAEQKQPWVVEGMSGNDQRRGGPQQAARHPAQAFADHPPDGREADHRCRGHRPVGFIQIETIGDGEGQAHRNPVAQRIAPLRRGCPEPRKVAPVHRAVPMETVHVVPETRVRSVGSWSKAMRTGMRCASRTQGILGLTSGTRPESVSTL